MHRIIWPHSGEVVGVNIGVESGDSFVPVLLKAADERLITVEANGAHMHFAVPWISCAVEGQFTVGNRPVKLLIELGRRSPRNNRALSAAVGTRAV